MRAVDHLPKGGEKFKSSNFKQKLNSAGGLLREVSDNKDAINKAVAKYSGLIKEGRFNSSYQNSALRNIKSTTNLSARQVGIVKDVLKRLSKTDDKKIKVSHARINRSDEQDIKGPGMANQPKSINQSGLSGVASPGNLDRRSSRPMVSISQAQKNNNPGLAGSKNLESGRGSSNISNRPPSISLAA
ncbi:MAG: hypothetical protein PHE20_03025 [Patescibacteria group bacterium]|nr:hypothetical protein [Patescibacteria group bacterium]